MGTAFCTCLQLDFNNITVFFKLLEKMSKVLELNQRQLEKLCIRNILLLQLRYNFVKLFLKIRECVGYEQKKDFKQ